jgi:hypothetical protein
VFQKMEVYYLDFIFQQEMSKFGKKIQFMIEIVLYVLYLTFLEYARIFKNKKVTDF